jgi:hypothetical protein
MVSGDDSEKRRDAHGTASGESGNTLPAGLAGAGGRGNGNG